MGNTKSEFDGNNIGQLNITHFIVSLYLPKRLNEVSIGG